MLRKRSPTNASPVPGPGLAPGPGVIGTDAPLPLRKSLRGKGFIATLVLLAYVLGSVLYVAPGRGKILTSIQALDRQSQHEQSVALAEACVNGALVDFNVASNAAPPEPALPADLAPHMESCAKLFAALDAFDPSYALLQRAIERSYQGLVGAPARANWIDLRDALGRAADALEIRRRSLAEQRAALTLAYQRHYDAVTVESLLLAAVGMALFGSLAAWFFARLAGDVRRLESHARQIVRGTRGVAMAVQRSDELGQLMHAVNRMASDLDEREKQIEVDHRRRSHQDKILSVAALAAGIAHEVNNPLAAIAGAAQALRRGPEAPTPQQIDDSAQLILAQAERAALAARQLADAAAPETSEPDWIDLNAMLRRVVQLTGYDRRFRQVRFDTRALDPALPALRTVGDALRQVLMQTIALACDAMVAAHQQPAVLELATGDDSREIEVLISFAALLDFDRPEIQRTLSLCRTIVEPLGGQLAFYQGDGPTWRFKLTLPLARGVETG